MGHQKSNRKKRDRDFLDVDGEHLARRVIRHPSPVLDDNFAMVFEGSLNIEAAGDYSFATTSNDGSQLMINDQLVVDNDGRHGEVTQSGNIELQPGIHRIQVSYFERAGDEILRVLMGTNPESLRTITRQDLNASLTWSYYEGVWSKLPDFSLMSPVKNGECDEFSLHVRNVPVSGVVTTMMPHLKAGLHQLNIKWENGVYNKQFRLTSVRLIKVGGEDLNGNGQQDWAEQKLHVECSVSGDTESYTSPFCLEGDGRYRSMMSLSTGEDILGGSGSKWYANVALDPTEAQIIQVQFQNGAKVEERLLKWKVTHGPDQVEAVSVRAGDSLLLSPSSASFPQAGAIVVAGDRHEVSMGETRVQRFDDVGDVEVTSIQYGENGEETSSTFVVRVVDVNLPTEALAAMIGNERHMDLNSHLVEGTVYDPDPRLLAWYTNHEGQVAFAVDAHQERRVMARLGENGPILDTLKFEGLKVYGSSSTWGRVMDTLEDGTKVMSMGILVDHFPPNLEVHLRIFLAGVTLDDGSLNRVLRQEDFNDRNEAEITLLKTPEASKTAACHHIDVYQNGQFVGRAY